jgi:hypothetical protein
MGLVARGLRVLATVACLATSLSCDGDVATEQTPAAPVDAQLAADLALVRAARVFFAHRSLGADVLDGVARVPGAGLRIVALGADAPLTVPDAALAHVLFAQDGDPAAKIAAFEQLLAGAQPSPDVALMKLSWADIDGNTDTKALFTRYREAIERLKRAHPQTVFVHVTAPLTVRDTGAAELFERLTGISDDAASANVRRDEYNGRLRAAFRGEPIFDLAALESLWPDGRSEQFERAGTRHPSLVPAYTKDGRQLSGLGQERSARALIHALAAAVRARTAH